MQDSGLCTERAVLGVNKYKALLTNIGLLTLGNFATKLLGFFLVPLYTNVLTTTEYGVYDLFNTTIGLLIPILTLNIQESVIRYAMDREYNREALVTVAVKYFVIGNSVVVGGLLFNYLFSFSVILKEYAVFFILMFFSQSLSGIVVGYIRGVDRIAQLSVSGVVTSLIVMVCNVCFLVVFKWGIIGYFMACIIGPLLQSVYLIYVSGMQRYIHGKTSYRKEEKELLQYCKPMIANSLAWWVNNASDRYMIVFFCGLSENGIYSAASKIPSILSTVQGIFYQAWTLSAVQNYDPEDKNGFFSDMYKAYNCVMVLICSAIIVIDKPLAKLLYAKDFYMAWEYVPWLAIAVVFGSMSGYIGGVFSAVKKSKIFAQTTMLGAVANVLMNLVLIPLMGAMGAAIATAVSYVIVWYVRYQCSKKYIRMRISLGKDLFAYLILSVQAIMVLVIHENKTLFLIQGGLIAVIIGIYASDVLRIAKVKWRGRS